MNSWSCMRKKHFICFCRYGLHGDSSVVCLVTSNFTASSRLPGMSCFHPGVMTPPGMSLDKTDPFTTRRRQRIHLDKYSLGREEGQVGEVGSKGGPEDNQWKGCREAENISTNNNYRCSLYPLPALWKLLGCQNGALKFGQLRIKIHSKLFPVTKRGKKTWCKGSKTIFLYFLKKWTNGPLWVWLQLLK